MPTVETNGFETYYERRGDGDPVVFVHGLGLDHRLWLPQFAALEDEYETVAYDYRGHGRTGPTETSEYSISLLAEDLRALVEALGLENPVLCAHSYGGLVAAEYAIQYPDDVSGLVFADARTGDSVGLLLRVMTRLQPAIWWFEDAVGEERVERAMQFVTSRLENAEQGPDETVPELGMKPSEYADEAHDALPREEQRKLMQAAIDSVGASPTAFHVPVLYTYGELTADTIADKAERLRRAPTDVRVREIENAGHGHPMARADAFNEALRAFLGETVGTSPSE